MARRSLHSHSFANIPSVSIPRSVFDRSHSTKTTFDAGYLIPIFVDEAVPGDTFSLRMAAFGRLATPLHPFMDQLYLSSFFFAVPVRLIWDNFKKFHGEQTDPGDSISYLVPTMDAPAGAGHVVGSLSDYFGIPTGVASLTHSSLWHRAYHAIWNEWFRDENLQNSAHLDTGDGPDTSTNYVLQRRGKRHDYFTSCLPWPQKGTAVGITLAGEAEVHGLGVENVSPLTGPSTTKETGGTATTSYANYFSTGSQSFHIEEDTGNSGYPGVYADLSTATAQTINSIRLAVTTQQLLEKDARAGTRYTEIIRSHFGVVSPDARQQRPEYLGGSTTLLSVQPVAQTSETGTTAQGNLAAFGTVSAAGHGFTKSFTEHCVVLGLVSVRSDLTYQQGLDRMFSRSTRYDFYFPCFAHIGEQAVLNKEIYADGSANDELVFGYQERYAEMRFKRSMITGQFRSGAATPLDTWHLSQEFGSLPTLNATFIQEDPPVDRVIATPADPHIILDTYFNYRCARPMPVYSVPGLTRF